MQAGLVMSNELEPNIIPPRKVSPLRVILLVAFAFEVIVLIAAYVVMLGPASY